MKKFQKINNIAGWSVLVTSAIVYLSTIEPTASFWDCGEFIASAFKLEVGHPPGAPFFMLLSRFFTMFAPDITKVALMVNIMSALASAFTILFLFWSITHLARKLLAKNEIPSTSQTISIIGSGLVGALAYTFSDTFWFSAVEGEVYALSSFFTAIVFWAILKWENEADQPYANRWLVFIAYMMGLSIGVHLLNLLAIPAIVFIYYFKKYPTTVSGVLAASMVSVAILGGVMYLIIPGTFKVASWFDLLFVNGFGLPFNSGLVFYSFLLVALFSWAIMYTLKHGKVVANTIILSVAVILIGYSSYALIIIRSNANTPLNENEPSNVFSLLSYLNREQYGDRPLLYGQYYNAPAIKSTDVQTYIEKNGKYVKSYLKTDYEFDSRFETIFPRMYSPSRDHVEEYKKWADIKGIPVTIQAQNGEPEKRYVPTFGENLRFFFSYQIGFMYMRYFMWNFVGRQDDVQSHGGLMNGNWISGIKALDTMHLGNQDNLTEEMKNHPSRNAYYFLPLLLGIAGFVYQYLRDKRNFVVVAFLFVLTGLAIVVYLNQYPLQPRERDYAYAGSFYAFAIWIGLGVLAVVDLLGRALKPNISSILASTVSMGIPILMGVQNWEDHDRSGRYTARDFAYNYLNSCEPNAILFTNGDNDTFPLWYAQEVEGIRTDVRVVNLSLLGTDWYIDQMKLRTYESDPIPISMTHDQYVQGKRDIVYIVDRLDGKTVELKEIVNFVASDNPETKLRIPDEGPVAYIPTKNLRFTVDKNTVLHNGTVKLQDSSLIVPYLEWSIKKSYIQKNDLAMLDIIATNNWNRPVYMVSPYGDSDIGLGDYLQLEGFVYRLVPIKTKAPDFLSHGRIDSERLYDLYINKFHWGRMNEPDVTIDHNNQRTATVLRLRNNFNRLSQQLIKQDKKDSALVVLDRIVELMPQDKYPYDFFMVGIIESYYMINQTDKANQIAQRYAKSSFDNLRYLFSLEPRFNEVVDYEKQINLQILQELSNMVDKYGQSDLKKEFDNYLNDYLGRYYQGPPTK